MGKNYIWNPATCSCKNVKHEEVLLPIIDIS